MLYFVGLFLYGIAEIGLLVGSPLGGCQCLGMLQLWLLLMMRFLVVWVLRFLVVGFSVLVVTTRWFWVSMSSTSVEEVVS